MVTENGTKVDLEAKGINTDLSKAQVITKDEVVEQIDTMLHTDLLNTETRAGFVADVKKAADGIGDIGAAINRGDLKYEDARTDRYAEYYIKTHQGMAELIKDPESKTEAEIKAETKEFIKYMTGKDVEVVIIADGNGSGYIDGNQAGEGKKDVFILDISQVALGESIVSIYGHETNHVDDNRRGRIGHNEIDSNSSGNRLEEIMGDAGKSNDFDMEAWLNKGNNLQALLEGNTKLSGDYAGYDIEIIQVNDQGLERAKKELKNCGSIACASHWSQIIGNIETSLKRTTVEAKRDKVENGKSTSQKKKERELAALKKKDEELKKQYVFTEEDKKNQQANNEYMYIKSDKNQKAISDLQTLTLTDKLPENTVIVVKDENGQEVRYNNYSDYYNSNSPEEKKKLGDLSAQNNKLIKDIENAKTKEEKNKLNQELTKVNQQMYDIVYGKMTYAELGTGMSLAYSAISYKDGVLVVDKKKMDQAVGTSNLSIGTTGLGLLDLQMALGNKAAIESGNNAKNDVIPKSDSYNEYAVKDSEIPNKIVSDVNKNSSNFNKLPNLEKAQIDSKKITNYALDPNHPVGGNKAKVFESSLGYNQSNSDSLIAQIKQQLPNSEAVLGVKNEYGQRFTVDMQIKGPNGNTATVRTGWIFDIGSDTPRLTTLFVK